ncbi:MAG TPA: radical SAM protein [Candidatus Tripitaka californicus]|uniref:radical SAM protein n=1 Tax=Candidatus Tripitaka californicus TaxID=3367616 RepID=UPI004026CE00
MLNGTLRKNYALLKEAILNGGPSFANFALTNACNARCGFCTFPSVPAQDRVYVEARRAKEALDILYDRGIWYITFVGGEPLLHPQVWDIIGYANGKGIVCMMSTNASYLNENAVRAMKEAGLRTLLISIATPSAEANERNRGLPGDPQHHTEHGTLLKRAGINCIASVTISKAIKDYFKLPGFLKGLGLERITFSNPMIRYSDSYAGYKDSPLIDYAHQAIIQVFQDIKRLKAEFTVLNPTASLDDMIRFFSKEEVKFLCLGGYKSFYVDWKLDVYPCQTLNEKMGAICEFPTVPFKRLNCNLCINECYREPSLMQYIAISVSDALADFRGGRLKGGIGRLLDGNNLISLWASVEEWRTGGRI